MQVSVQGASNDHRILKWDGCHQKYPITCVMQDGAAVAAPLQIEGTSWPMTCVSMGNPHAVTFGPADSPIQVDSLPLAQLGPHFETHPAFPAKTNTEFVEVRIPPSLLLKTEQQTAV